MEKSKKYDLIVIINSTLDTIDKQIRKNITNNEFKSSLFNIMKDLRIEFEEYSKEDTRECGKLVIKRYIPLINLLIKTDTDKKRQFEYHAHLENAYKLAARVSLEHFIVYLEWYEEDKLLEPRYEILKSYVYYLNKMCFDETFEGMIVNLPSGYGKSRICRYYEAFRLRIRP